MADATLSTDMDAFLTTANDAAARAELGLGTAAVLASDTDVTLAANSDTRAATQKAVKAYVDTAVTGLLDYKGATDCSGNPNYPAASKGDSYLVSVAGKIGGASGAVVAVGDMYVALADNAGGTQAGVGTSWNIIEHNLPALATIATTGSADDLGSGTVPAARIPVDVPLGLVAIQIACSDTTSDITAGNGKITFRMPFPCTLVGVRASVTTAPTGSGIIIDINEEGTSVLSTKLSIDASEKTSTTAATPPVISDAALADDAEMSIDFDQVGSTIPGVEVKVTLLVTRN